MKLSQCCTILSLTQIKTTKLLALILGLTVTASADTVTWNQDSTSGFEVTITGQGAGGTGPAYYFQDPGASSPSGLWSFGGGGHIVYHSDAIGTLGEWETMGGFSVSYNASTLPSDYPVYAGAPILRDIKYDLFPGSTVPPYAGEQMGANVYSDPGFGLGFYGWHAGETTEVTVVDSNDPSTWTWIVHVSARGPDLYVNVPDVGCTIALLGGAFVGLATLRRRFVK